MKRPWIQNREIVTIIDGYDVAARNGIVARFESINSEKLFAPIIDLLPPSPCHVADIGAGTGRDAAWLASQGYHVVAVEPAEGLRMAGKSLHDQDQIEWLDDHLPDLKRVNRVFNLITLCGVWQHLNNETRRPAMKRITDLITPGGRLILSLRNGPGAEDRPVYPADPDVSIEIASLAGLDLMRRVEASSVQRSNRALGVTWTWLAFEKNST